MSKLTMQERYERAIYRVREAIEELEGVERDIATAGVVHSLERGDAYAPAARLAAYGFVIRMREATSLARSARLDLETMATILAHPNTTPGK